MRSIQRLGAIVAASLLLPNPGWAKPDTIGVVLEANHASLGAYAASEGSGVFDGDRLSTGTGGALRLRSGRAMLYLKNESSVIVRKKTEGPEKVLEAELFAGELVLSAAEESGTEILVRNARIRPGDGTAAILQVRLLGPKTLSIFARRGTAKFSYRGEAAVIAEGKSYRVELDPPEDGGSADKNNKKETSKNRFIFFVIVPVAVASVPLIWRALESPDRP
jgi:hypothetical protein